MHPHPCYQSARRQQQDHSKTAADGIALRHTRTHTLTHSHIHAHTHYSALSNQGASKRDDAAIPEAW